MTPVALVETTICEARPVRQLSDDARRALLVDRQWVGGRRAGRSVVDVAHAVGPLHSTDPSSAYLQVAARSDCSVDDITRALYDDRLLLRHTTLRRTVHLLTPEVARAAHGAYNHRLVPKLRGQLVDWLGASEDVDGDPSAWLADVEERVVDAVGRLDRPTGNALADEVAELRVTVDPAPGTSYGRPIRITSKVIEVLIADGRIARDRPRSGDLTSGAWTYGPITDWLADGLGSTDPAEALQALLLRKLGSAPGASTADLAWWTGLPKGMVERALAALDAEPVDRDDTATGWLIPGDDLDADDPADDAVSLLPGLDATPMGFKERTWFLGAHEAALFDRNGNIGPTIWWRGRVVGGWTHRSDGVVATGVLDRVPQRAAAAISEEAERLQDWLGDVRVRWRYPTPLQRSLELA